MSSLTSDFWFAGVAIVTFAVMMSFPLAVWKRCGQNAHRLLKNDPAFGFFTPLIFPLAMGVLAKTVAGNVAAVAPRHLFWLAVIFAVFVVFAAMLIHADMKIGPLEPYMVRGDDALLYETEIRAKLHVLYREIHTGDLSPDQTQIATDEIKTLQRDAAARYGELAAGFTSWRDLRDRGTGAARVQVFVNSIVATGCAALFAWLIIAAYRHDPNAPKEIAEATAAVKASAMLCVGLLMLWFPLRLYSEWYTGFYTFRGLREYWTFWFLAVCALVGMLLIAILSREKAALPYGLAAFGTAVLVMFGVLAKLKPEALGYAAVVFEEMPLVPYLLTLIVGLFAVLLVIVLKSAP